MCIDAPQSAPERGCSALGRPISSVLLLAFLGAGCGAASPSAAPAKLPAFVSVQLRQALVAPTKTAGARWDGPPLPDLGVIGLVADALGKTNAYSAVANLLASPVVAAFERPDPVGLARVMIGGSLILEQPLETAGGDTLTPLFSATPPLRVPFVPSAHVEVTLWDHDDITQDDPIGAANLSYDDLLAALRAGNQHPVRVADQTNQQLLFLDILVYAAP